MRRAIVFTALAAVFFLSGCSSSDSATPTSGPAARDAGAEAVEQPGKPPADGTNADTDGPVAGRSIIYKGDLTLQVDDVDAVAKRIVTLLPAEGYVDSGKSGGGQASLTVRVPAKSFTAFLDQIAGLGKEVSRTTNTEDVTQAVLDLDTRIASQQASVAAAQRLYAQAKTFADLSAADRDVRARETELAALVAKKNRLDDLIALSTVTITLIGPAAEVEDEPLPGFFGGLREGWDAFTLTVEGGLTVLGYLLPFLIALAIPIGGLIALRRVRRKRSA